MPTIGARWTGVPDTGAGAGYLVQWGPMANGDVGEAIAEISNQVSNADRSVQVEGTFGAGGTVAITGSNDGVNFRVINDPSITSLIFTTAKIRAILEAVRQIRPEVTAGDGNTAVTVSMLFRRLR